jgi:TolB-like protein
MPLTTRLNAARSAVADTGEKQRLIKTLPRKGFRFVGTVQEVQRPAIAPVSSAQNDDTVQRPFSPPRLSIIVLPFANLSGDSRQDYFVDGITESLTTDLSRIRGSFVIGRHTAFTYQGKSANLKEIGQELGVRYVLEGSVQRSEGRLRVNVQLVDAETGAHLWADRFDTAVVDLFDMQDEIVSRLANTLHAQLTEQEARRSERSPHPNSMDFYFQGKSWLYKGWTPEYLAKARGLFERALALDPNNVEAMVWTAVVDLVVGAAYMSDDKATLVATAEATLIKVLSTAPNHAVAHLYMATALMATNRVAQGIAECERALSLDRNLAEAHAQIGMGKFYLGRGAEIEAHINEAFRLSPRDIFAFDWLMMVGLAKLQLTADAEAVIWFRRSVEANRNYPPRISRSAPHSRCSARRTRRGPPLKPDLRSTQPLPFVASASTHKAIIQPTSPNASVSLRACAWPGFRSGNVGDGSIASSWLREVDFRSSSMSGHFQGSGPSHLCRVEV